MLKALALLVIALPLSAFAMEPKEKPLGFGTWKERQILEAQNNVVRQSNRLHLLREQQRAAAAQTEAGWGGYQGGDTGRSEEELKRALEGLQFSKDLGIEDYLAVYLSQFSENEGAVRDLSQRMSKDDVSELVRVALKRSASEEKKGSTEVVGANTTKPSSL